MKDLLPIFKNNLDSKLRYGQVVKDGVSVLMLPPAGLCRTILSRYHPITYFYCKARVLPISTAKLTVCNRCKIYHRATASMLVIGVIVIHYYCINTIY